jgi:hypothetical protein
MNTSSEWRNIDARIGSAQPRFIVSSSGAVRLTTVDTLPKALGAGSLPVGRVNENMLGAGVEVPGLATKSIWPGFGLDFLALNRGESPALPTPMEVTA